MFLFAPVFGPLFRKVALSRFSKTFATNGGFVATRTEAAHVYLRHHCGPLLFSNGLSPLQAARLALAVRTLAGQGGEGLVGNIRQGAGLADFDVTTDDEGNTEVRAGAYLSEDIYTDVTIDGAGETRLNLNFDLTPSVTVKGSASNEGDTSVGVFFERDY